MHHNIPPPKEDIVNRDFCRAGWFFVTLLGPELVAALAAIEYLDCRRLTSGFQKLGCSKDEQWTITHSFYARMGGYMMHSEGGTPFAAMTYDLGLLIEAKIIELSALTSVTRDDIKAKRKTDSIAKGIASIQAGWFLLNTIGRAASHLPISQLELSTSAFVMCMLVIYGLWWHKATGVQAPTLIQCGKISSTIPLTVRDPYTGPRKCILGHSTPAKIRHHPEVKLSDLPSGFTHESFVIFAALGSIFCAVELAAWDFSFPSVRERHLWRFCSALAAAGPAVVGFAMYLVTFISLPETTLLGITSMLAAQLLTYYYIVSRFIILGISFSTLRSMLAGIYDTLSWASALPHMTVGESASSQTIKVLRIGG